jgi:hypothetical protein
LTLPDVMMGSPLCELEESVPGLFLDIAISLLFPR